MKPFTMRFRIRDIPYWSARYEDDDAIPLALGPRARARGYLTKFEFLELARWKTARTRKRCAANDDAFVRAVTRTALSTTNERLRIESLTLLSGVHWPTASVILHFCSAKPFPILDYRALWSLSHAVPAGGYRFPFWNAYCLEARRLSAKANVSMRALDRALWQYSREHQGTA